MGAIIGLALICSGLIVFRIAAAGAAMQPPAWWASDAMAGNVIVPFCVGALGFGVAELLAWAFGGDWRSLTLVQAIGIGAVVGAYVMLGRAIRAWSRRARPAVALAEPSRAAGTGDAVS